MVLFATPDFGAAGGIVLILAGIWAVALLLAAGAFFWGTRLIDHGSRKFGAALVLLSVLLPLTCCFGPQELFRLHFGNYPLPGYPKSIQPGMTKQQVEADLGTPHQVGNDTWYYWLDSYGLGYFGVIFDADGRVVRTHRN